MAHEIKVMLNPLRTLKDGRKALVLRLTVNRKRNYYSLGYRAFADEINLPEMKFYKNGIQTHIRMLMLELNNNIKKR